MRVRPAVSSDRDGAYRVALGTAANGDDATGSYRYPDLLGHVYVGQYLQFQPGLCSVLVGDTGATIGYVLGAVDTADFEERLERDWWPELRREFPLGMLEDDGVTDLDRELIERIHIPVLAPRDVRTEFPSHGHIDLLAVAQGRGWGGLLMRQLMDSLAADGSIGMHLEVGLDNGRARAFYAHLGFREGPTVGDAIYLVRDLP